MRQEFSLLLQEAGDNFVGYRISVSWETGIQLHLRLEYRLSFRGRNTIPRETGHSFIGDRNTVWNLGSRNTILWETDIQSHTRQGYSLLARRHLYNSKENGNSISHETGIPSFIRKVGRQFYRKQDHRNTVMRDRLTISYETRVQYSVQ
jgi:hypothetical protein